MSLLLLNVRLTALLMVACACAQGAQAQTTSAEQAMARERAADSIFHHDYANLARYRDENARLPAPVPGVHRVVFMGNSITEGWQRHFSAMFPGRPYVNRGIGGQTTPQMLVRFHADVVALEPAVVVILGGTNDLAGNTGPSTNAMIQQNLQAMTEIAQANGIRVVLSSILPVFDYPWRPGLQPAPRIVSINAWMKAYAAKVGATYLDYHGAMRDSRDGLRSEFGADGVHPNEMGYRTMAALLEPAIAAALRAR
ncbi:MAG TPA: SGNH/GDSL hydrolase family protein [Gemmatimonadaceae bacterium]|nr:SGNH/GDSL hydrolase family protein [Gemmatimonadaceae bacterium]